LYSNEEEETPFGGWEKERRREEKNRMDRIERSWRMRAPLSKKSAQIPDSKSKMEVLK
jgi:hypothetical protein